MRAAAVRLTVLAALGGTAGGLRGQTADLILHNGRIVTVDSRDSIREAIAVAGERILRVGASAEVLAAKGPETRVVDLGGRTVLPGLIDSHTHPSGACMTEFDHPVPEMQSVEDVLEYIRSRARAIEPGGWIQVRQVFITRLKEQRYPTREELDRAAPAHPVIFSTGPDASLNTLALKRSGIDRDFKITDGGPGAVERDLATGEPSGILRSCTRLVKYEEPSSRRRPSEEDQLGRLRELFRDYNSAGITSIADRDAGGEAIARYERLLAKGELTVRIACSRHLDTAGPVATIEAEVRKVAEHPLRKGGPMLRVIGVKTFLDGGMLTGSAYLREPWGKSKIYSIEDPSYRGMLLIPREKLFPIVRATLEAGLQFTAHSVGDGAVHLLLEAYEEANRVRPIRPARPSLTHANFMSREAVEAMARLGVVADIQPAWLWLDTRTLAAHFGSERLRYFQPLKSLFAAGALAGGGSDHMQKIGSLRSINPYNPFLGMWVAITRKAKDFEGRLHAGEALTRLQAIRFYTLNNAYILFQEERTGSIEEGKLADLIILDRDLLACPEDEIREVRVLRTYLSGKPVHERPEAP